MSRLVEGKSVELGRDGALHQERLTRNNITPADVHEALHSAGLESAAGMHRMFLEPSGRLAAWRDYRADAVEPDLDRR